MVRTVFITYMFGTLNDGDTIPYTDGVSLGFSNVLYCNNIKKFETDDFRNKRVNFLFDTDIKFPYMLSAENMASRKGYGWSAKKMFILIQYIGDIGLHVKPESDKWKMVDVTNIIPNYEIWKNQCINPEDLLGLSITLKDDVIHNAPYFDLAGLYKQQQINETNGLLFGEENFFFGNIKTNIAADIYRTVINVVLPQDEYNRSDNPTWSQGDDVYITDIGIYDSENNLVGIGKLNRPILKNNTKTKTIEFNLDF
jgi:hypothetical protein